MKAINKAIQIAGGVKELCLLLDIKTEMTIRQWVKRDSVPAERVISIERVTGVPRHELRPDIYPPNEYKQAG